MRRVILISILSFIAFPVVSKNKEIVVIIPSYNNSAFYKQNLDSVFNQTYTHFKVLYIDDQSSDGTYESVQNYCVQHHFSERITLIHNRSRHGALANLFNAIHGLEDHVIVVTLDGDDWFSHNKVLEKINAVYQDEAVWMTYGSYIAYPEKTLGAWRAIPNCVIQANTFRESAWLSSHLRTFYAKLFKTIKKEDLLYENQFFQVTWDMAFMFPMLEMAGIHSRHIPEVLYVYNQSNPINDFKVRLSNVMHMDTFIRNKKKYNPLNALF